jgi:hypothetical protein
MIDELNFDTGFQAIVSGVVLFALWMFLVQTNVFIRRLISKDLLKGTSKRLMLLKSLGPGWFFGFPAFIVSIIIQKESQAGKIDADEAYWFGLLFFTLGLCVYLWNYARLSRLSHEELLVSDTFASIEQDKTDKAGKA